MQLLVDIGNSRIKWRLARQGQLLPGGAEPLPVAGDEEVLFERIWRDGTAPERVLVSNVSGQRVCDALQAWSHANWGCKAEFVASAAHLGGVSSGYREPATLGVDRWCALVGARAIARGSLCVVDCGTAITVDLLSPDGSHAGGLIAPGLRTMAKALTGSTRGIPVEVALAPFTAPLGRSTAECIRAGVLAAAIGMVEHTLDRLTFPAEGLVLLTGGDAELVAAGLKRPHRIEPDLVFHGLAVVGGL